MCKPTPALFVAATFAVALPAACGGPEPTPPEASPSVGEAPPNEPPSFGAHPEQIAALTVIREDLDGDGLPDVAFYDYDDDGNPDAAVVDWDRDGHDDEVWFDSDDDGDWDRVRFDDDDDGKPDRGIADWEPDDALPTWIWTDQDGDGEIDTDEIEDAPDQEPPFPGPRPSSEGSRAAAPPSDERGGEDADSADEEPAEQPAEEPAEEEAGNQPPCEGAVELVRQSYWECRSGTWHSVEAVEWQCPDGSIQRTESATDSGEPCTEPGATVFHTEEDAHFDDETCPLAVLLSESEGEVCVGEELHYEYSALYGCADGTLTELGGSEVIGWCEG